MKIEVKHPAFKRSLIYLLGLMAVLLAGRFLVNDGPRTATRSLAALPAADSTVAQPALRTEPDLTGQMLKVLGVTAAIIVVMLVLWRLYLRLGGQHNNAPGMLRILSRQSLGPRQYLTLVQAGERRLLLGVTEQNITLIADLSDADLPLTEIPSPTAATSFAAILNGLGLKQHESQN